jgi:hypothetical protein
VLNPQTTVVLMGLKAFVDRNWTRGLRQIFEQDISKQKYARPTVTKLGFVEFLTGWSQSTIRRAQTDSNKGIVRGETHNNRGARRGRPTEVDWGGPEVSAFVHSHLDEHNKKTGAGTNYKKMWRSAMNELPGCADVPYNTFREAVKKHYKVRACKGDTKHPLREARRTMEKRCTFLETMHDAT